MTKYTTTELEAVNFFQNIYNRVWTKEYTDMIIFDIKESLKEYLHKAKLDCYVLPLSGGLDSAIVCGLCEELPLRTAFLDINNSETHFDMALSVSEKFGNRCQYINLESEFEKMKIKMLKEFESDSSVANGNIKARLRMITAYHMARVFNGCVLSTDNYSEYNMGFWTLHGDVGDVSPIQFLNKGFELQFIAKQLGVPEDVINQAPSDGLGVTEENTDEAQLGANYKFVDASMMLYLRQNCGSINNEMTKEERKYYLDLSKRITKSKKYLDIIERYEKTKYKRITQYEFNPFKVNKEEVV